METEYFWEGYCDPGGSVRTFRRGEVWISNWCVRATENDIFHCLRVQ